MDCTLGGSGQTKGQRVGRCRWWCSPGCTHQGCFQDLVKQRQSFPAPSVRHSLALRGNLHSASLLQAKITISFWFSLVKTQVFWSTQMFLNNVPSNLNQILPRILVNLNKRTNKQHWISTLILYWQQSHTRSFTIPAVESKKSRARSNLQRSLTWFLSPDMISS